MISLATFVPAWTAFTAPTAGVTIGGRGLDRAAIDRHLSEIARL
ncbi:MAG: hypothetical protein ACOY71_11560 [Gemmatimonadota bacterium]